MNLPENILIVDDDVFVRDNVYRVLAEAGYAVEAVPSGPAALVRLGRGNDVHGVLLAVTLPGRAGLETMARIQARWPHLPVILISDPNHRPATLEALEAGAVDYLDRPLDPDRLRIAIRRALRTARLEARVQKLEGATGDAVGDASPSDPGRILSACEEERRYLARALRITGGNIQEAAQALRISRATLYRKIRKYGLPRDIG